MTNNYLALILPPDLARLRPDRHCLYVTFDDTDAKSIAAAERELARVTRSLGEIDHIVAIYAPCDMFDTLPSIAADYEIDELAALKIKYPQAFRVRAKRNAISFGDGLRIGENAA